MGARLEFLIHTLWIVLLVPSKPLSLLAVSLALVNGSHHWPVIKRLSSVFNFDTYIHMLEFVLWLGRVGALDPGLRLQKSWLRGDVTWSCLYTCLFQMDGCDHTMSLLYVILLIIGWLQPYLGLDMILLTGWLSPYLGSIYMILFWSPVSIPRFMYLLLEISVMYMYLYFLAGFLMTISDSMHLLVKHFTPHSCSAFTL